MTPQRVGPTWDILIARSRFVDRRSKICTRAHGSFINVFPVWSVREGSVPANCPRAPQTYKMALNFLYGPSPRVHRNCRSLVLPLARAAPHD